MRMKVILFFITVVQLFLAQNPQCRICGKSFETSSELREHTAAQHQQFKADTTAGQYYFYQRLPGIE